MSKKEMTPELEKQYNKEMDAIIQDIKAKNDGAYRPYEAIQILNARHPELKDYCGHEFGDHNRCFKCGTYWHPVYNTALFGGCWCGKNWVRCFRCAEIQLSNFDEEIHRQFAGQSPDKFGSKYGSDVPWVRVNGESFEDAMARHNKEH